MLVTDFYRHATGRFLLHKGRNFKVATQGRYYVLTEDRQGVEVAKARLAAKPLVEKPNGDSLHTACGK